MSGKDANRGFIFQTIVAIIDCLELDSWDSFKMEPGTDNDKIDYQFYKDGDIIFKVQVKTTINGFSERQVSNYVDQLNITTSDTTKIYLYLVSRNWTKSKDLQVKGHVEIKTIPYDYLEVKFRNSLIDYVKKKRYDANLTLEDLETISDKLFSKIHNNNIQNEPITRKDFEKIFLHCIPKKRIIEISSKLARLILFVILTFAFISILSLYVIINDHKILKQVNNNTANFVDDFNPEIITSESVSTKYQIAINLFKEQRYDSAIDMFKDAIKDQKHLTGSDSIEMAGLYYGLGLASLYNERTRNTRRDKAVSALISAQTIFDKNDDKWNSLNVDYALGTAFYENGDYNRATDYCVNTIDSLNNMMDSFCIKTDDGYINEILSVFAFGDDYLQTLYKISDLRACVLNLWGKIYTDEGEYKLAFNCFSDATRACCDLYYADSRIRFYNSMEESMENEGVLQDESSTNENEYLDIKIFDFNHEDNTITKDYYRPLYKNARAATILSNRAQAANALAMFDVAEEDCFTALKIWDNLDFSEKYNISFAYRALIVAKQAKYVRAMVNTNGEIIYENEDFSTSGLKDNSEVLSELMSYADAAIVYDSEFFGEDHWRTALSYETKGSLLFMSGEIDAAIAEYEKALAINTEWEDENAAEIDRKNIANISSHKSSKDK